MRMGVCVCDVFERLRGAGKQSKAEPNPEKWRILLNQQENDLEETQGRVLTWANFSKRVAKVAVSNLQRASRMLLAFLCLGFKEEDRNKGNMEGGLSSSSCSAPSPFLCLNPHFRRRKEGQLVCHLSCDMKPFLICYEKATTPFCNCLSKGSRPHISRPPNQTRQTLA